MTRHEAILLLADNATIALAGKATSLARIDNCPAIVLYETTILRWTETTIELDTGDHNTKLTLDRMNTYLTGWRVYRKSGVFYAWRPGRPNDDPIPFVDNRLTLPHI